MNMQQKVQQGRSFAKALRQGSRKDKMMVQVAAALLFAVAAGFGIAVIFAMLRNNADAIFSALLGEGAFTSPAAPGPTSGGHAIKLRPTPARPSGTLHSRPRPRSLTLLSRAA